MSRRATTIPSAQQALRSSFDSGAKGACAQDDSRFGLGGARIAK